MLDEAGARHAITLAVFTLRALLSVACAAQDLEVVVGVGAAKGDRQDVVYLRIIGVAATTAGFPIAVQYPTTNRW